MEDDNNFFLVSSYNAESDKSRLRLKVHSTLGMSSISKRRSPFLRKNLNFDTTKNITMASIKNIFVGKKPLR